jgi:hypothetical protein
MINNNTLPTDIYYRGYRLSITGDGHPENDTHIFKDADHIDTLGSADAAKAQVDDWVDNAR